MSNDVRTVIERQPDYIDNIFDLSTEMLYSVLGWFTGMWDFLVPFFTKRKKGRLLFLGLDNSGKTTLLGRLKHGQMIQPSPTPVPSSEEVTFGKITFTTYDLGGHRQARRIWLDYYPAADAILFLIDSGDRERFTEAKLELHGLLSDEEITHVPIAVLVNKDDMPAAANIKEIAYKFELKSMLTGKTNLTRDACKGRRPLEVFGSSVLLKRGYMDALKWIAEFIE